MERNSLFNEAGETPAQTLTTINQSRSPDPNRLGWRFVMEVVRESVVGPVRSMLADSNRHPDEKLRRILEFLNELSNNESSRSHRGSSFELSKVRNRMGSIDTTPAALLAGIQEALSDIEALDVRSNTSNDNTNPAARKPEE